MGRSSVPAISASPLCPAPSPIVGGRVTLGPWEDMVPGDFPLLGTGRCHDAVGECHHGR